MSHEIAQRAVDILVVKAVVLSLCKQSGVLDCRSHDCGCKCRKLMFESGDEVDVDVNDVK